MGCAMLVKPMTHPWAMLCKCNLWHVHGLCYASATYDTSMGCAMQVQPITHPWATYDSFMGCAMLVQPMSHAWAVLCKCHLWHVHGLCCASATYNMSMCALLVPPMTCPWAVLCKCNLWYIHTLAVLSKYNLWHMHGLCYASAIYDTCMGCVMQVPPMTHLLAVAMQVQPMAHAWAVLCKCNLWHMHGLCYASAIYDAYIGCAMQVQPAGINTKSVSSSSATSLVVTVLWGQ